MQDKIVKKFGFCTEFLEELESKHKRKTLSTFLGIIGIFIIIYYFSKRYWMVDGGKMLFGIIIIIFIFAIINDFRTLNQTSIIISNINKNVLEIKNTYICGVFTDNPKITDNDKYFKLEYNQIDKIEIKNIDISMGEYHNFYIYSSTNLIKLAIESPDEAYTIILKAINQNNVDNLIATQAYKCPKCEEIVFYGQNNCENCGQIFDWSKLQF